MSAVVIGDHVILVGGVGLENSPDLIIVNITHRLWFGARVGSYQTFDGVDFGYLRRV